MKSLLFAILGLVLTGLGQISAGMSEMETIMNGLDTAKTSAGLKVVESLKSLRQSAGDPNEAAKREAVLTALEQEFDKDIAGLKTEGHSIDPAVDEARTASVDFMIWYRTEALAMTREVAGVMERDAAEGSRADAEVQTIAKAFDEKGVKRQEDLVRTLRALATQSRSSVVLEHPRSFLYDLGGQLVVVFLLVVVGGLVFWRLIARGQKDPRSRALLASKKTAVTRDDPEDF